MSIGNLTLASSYGEALFEAALKSGNLESVAEQAKVLVDTFSANRRLVSFLEAPSITKDVKDAMVVRVFEDRLERTLFNFLRLLIRRGRVELLLPALHNFRARHDKRHGITAASISTATELSDDEKRRLEESLAEFTGLKLVVNYKTDESLLGGVRFLCGDLLIDSTLYHELAKLRHRLLQTKVY